MPRKWFFTLLASLTIAGLALTGCATGGSGPAEPSGTLRINWGQLPQTWAPGAGMTTGQARIPYETLLSVGEDGEVGPNLVTEWELTDTDLTLHLREGVTFHDGTAFDAEAAKVNIEYVRDNAGRYSGSLRVIESIDIVDDHTLVLNLSNPAPTLPETLGYRNVMVASPAAIADGSVVSEPVGTGPWKYDAAGSIEGTRLSFVEFEEYWGQKPGYATIELYAIADDTAATAALLAGEIDITVTSETTELPRLENEDNVGILIYPAITANFIFFDRGPGGMFEDVNLRKAMCYALDLTVVDALEDSQVRPQHFLEGDVAYNPDVQGYAHDLTAAQRHYDAAGSPTLQFAIPRRASGDSQREQVYAEQLSALSGVTVTYEDLTPTQFTAQWNSGVYPMGSGNNSQYTAYDWYVTWFAAAAGANPAGAESAMLKAAANTAIAAGDTEQAEQLWLDVIKIIVDDEALACGFFTTNEFVAYNEDAVTNVGPPVTPWETSNINYRALTPVS